MKYLPTLIGFLLLALTAAPLFAADFDHDHAVWDELVKKHVVWINDGVASEVDYVGFQKDRDRLKTYLDDLSAVSSDEFQGWTKDDQLAFLINAYNAFTIELILTEYPEIDSIKDIGGFLSNPWKQEFFVLLGEERHLDWVEHERIREPGVYNDPRIHAGVNCASIGCPALRDEAFVGARIDAQLEDQMKRFLRDETRNRYNAEEGELQVSKIFDWFESDFNSGWMGYNSHKEFFADYAEELADTPEDREKVKNGDYDLDFLNYDWGLNDVS